ncbi:MAG: hypothetical protein WAX89_02600 [Alphaproteobacteria bacterium]
MAEHFAVVEIGNLKLHFGESERAFIIKVEGACGRTEELEFPKGSHDEWLAYHCTLQAALAEAKKKYIGRSFGVEIDGTQLTFVPQPDREMECRLEGLGEENLTFAQFLQLIGVFENAMTRCGVQFTSCLTAKQRKVAPAIELETLVVGDSSFGVMKDEYGLYVVTCDDRQQLADLSATDLRHLSELLPRFVAKYLPAPKAKKKPMPKPVANKKVTAPKKANGAASHAS